MTSSPTTLQTITITHITNVNSIIEISIYPKIPINILTLQSLIYITILEIIHAINLNLHSGVLHFHILNSMFNTSQINN